MASTAYSDRIILNEVEIMGTCTKSCYRVGTFYDKHGCTELSDCHKSSTGWIRGFVYCDYCNCECTKKKTTVDIRRTTSPISKTEPELYGTCTGHCNHAGVVRTNIWGCEQVKNCRKNTRGWIRFFVRCDYCHCDCVKTTKAQEYQLKNVKYYIDQAKVIKDTPIKMARTVITNNGDQEQEITRTLAVTHESSTSLSSERRMDSSLTIEVSAGVSVGTKAVIGVSTTVSTTISLGFSITAQETQTKSITDTIEANAKVPGKHSKEVLVTGRQMRLEIPYVADVVTSYEDGSTKTDKNVKGTFKNVDMGDFHVEYKKATPL
ncbi:natterin-2-like [Tubulanus polymorphus]|uniref:natterin-2-like n=1 Tax=Tubulanus polymorphus TaxID=672921 RepID=UPI003DA1D22E